MAKKQTTKKSAKKKAAKAASKKTAKKAAGKPSKTTVSKKKVSKRAPAKPAAPENDGQRARAAEAPPPEAERGAGRGAQEVSGADRVEGSEAVEDKRVEHFYQRPPEHGEPSGKPRGRKPTHADFKRRFKKRK